MRIPLPVLGLSLLLFAGCTSTVSQNGGQTSSSSSALPCTMEAKICPDGSSVGRTGPNCEFAACSGARTSWTGSTVSDANVTFTAPEGFALAQTSEQILVKSYIPQCEPGFLYCFYFNAETYAGTNLNGAGVGITKRADLKTADDCMTAQPAGYANLKPVTHSEVGYKTALFAGLDDAGAGHYAHDRLYRLSIEGVCYEIHQRIGFTQIANYPAGSIKEFTTSDEANLQLSLDAVLNHMTLPGGQQIVFPVSSK